MMRRKEKGGTAHVRSGFMLLLAVAIVVSYRMMHGDAVATTSFLANIASVEVLAAATSRVAVDSSRVCSQNPYAEALTDPLDVIAKRADAWLDNMAATIEQASAPSLSEHTHARFFPFDANMAGCKSMACVGGRCKADQSKFVCGLDELQKEKTCVVYSIGGNNQWKFEIDMLEKTPCEIHTFDCTGPKRRFRKPDNERLHFHHVCLGTENEDAKADGEKCTKCGATWTLLEMQQRLGHTRIDLLKVDIEGFEWPLLESWPILTDPEAQHILHPMQLLVEVHYWTLFNELWGPHGAKNIDFKSPSDMVNLQARLLRMGYVVVERDDNRHCMHCTELTLVRNRCPELGVYAMNSTLARK
jgi:hypothetical protein